jgi:hypothetical protein
MAHADITVAGMTVILGGKLVASVSSNNLTVAVKTLTGNDPSPGEYVTFCFRDSSLAAGNYEIIKVAEPMSVTIATGLSSSVLSDLGTANGVPFRLWALAINDGGALRLGLVHCYGTVAGGPTTILALFPLDEGALISTYAPGSAVPIGLTGIGMIRSDVEVLSKPFRIAGYLTWNSGLVTAGQWASGPNVIQLFGPGVK